MQQGNSQGIAMSLPEDAMTAARIDPTGFAGRARGIKIARINHRAASVAVSVTGSNAAWPKPLDVGNTRDLITTGAAEAVGSSSPTSTKSNSLSEIPSMETIGTGRPRSRLK